jgi:hypothetical protein
MAAPSITLSYLLSQEGQQAAALQGMDAAREQRISVTPEHPQWARAVPSAAFDAQGQGTITLGPRSGSRGAITSQRWSAALTPVLADPRVRQALADVLERTGSPTIDDLLVRDEASLRAGLVIGVGEWSEEHYKQVASEYLQTAFEVMDRARTLGLHELIELLDPQVLVARAAGCGDPDLAAAAQEWNRRLRPDELSTLAGLRRRLNELAGLTAVRRTGEYDRLMDPADLLADVEAARAEREAERALMQVEQQVQEQAWQQARAALQPRIQELVAGLPPLVASAARSPHSGLPDWGDVGGTWPLHWLVTAADDPAFMTAGHGKLAAALGDAPAVAEQLAAAIEQVRGEAHEVLEELRARPDVAAEIQRLSNDDHRTAAEQIERLQQAVTALDRGEVDPQWQPKVRSLLGWLGNLTAEVRKLLDEAGFLLEAEAWASKHGSERLRRIVQEGFLADSLAVYRDERLAKERPGWRWASEAPGKDRGDPRNPPLEALQLLEQARAAQPDAKLRYWMVTKGDLVDETVALELDADGVRWTGYAVVAEFLGRDVVCGVPSELSAAVDA